MRKGKRVLVTDGINANGTAIVRKFSSYGSSLAFFYNNSYDKALSLSKETGALNIRCKISNIDSVWAAREVIREFFKNEFDTLICNLSLGYNTGFDNMSSDCWNKEVIAAINGIFYTIRALRPFIDKKGGSIVIVLTRKEKSGFAIDILESYIKGLTVALSKDFLKANIRVNTLIYDEPEGLDESAADAVRQLASNESSFITGQIIRI